MVGFSTDGIISLVFIISMCRQTEIHMEPCTPGSIYSFHYICGQALQDTDFCDPAFFHHIWWGLFTTVSYRSFSRAIL